jgi:hypothetical protein
VSIIPHSVSCDWIWSNQPLSGQGSNSAVSWCLAKLDPYDIGQDTEFTMEFVNKKFAEYQTNDLALSIIQTMFESLKTYHLPIEYALGSIDDRNMHYVEDCYDRNIKMIKTERQMISLAAQTDSLIDLFSFNVLHPDGICRLQTHEQQTNNQ